MSRLNVKEYMMSLQTTTDTDPLAVWLEATASIPEFHGALVSEWHSRNFSQEEADEVNEIPRGFLPIETASRSRARDERGQIGGNDER